MRIANSVDHSLNPAGCLLSRHGDFWDGPGQMFQSSNNLKLTCVHSKMPVCALYPQFPQHATKKARRGHKTCSRTILRAESSTLDEFKYKTNTFYSVQINTMLLEDRITS